MLGWSSTRYCTYCDMLLTQGVTKKYNDGLSLTFPDCELKDGNQCVLVGDSGSGKIALLHILGEFI